jgi:hypothetical protein
MDSRIRGNDGNGKRPPEWRLFFGFNVNRSRADARRTDWLEAQGYRVIRFGNEELMGDLDAVLERIPFSL